MAASAAVPELRNENDNWWWGVKQNNLTVN
jgi:hypothetical protein